MLGLVLTITNSIMELESHMAINKKNSYVANERINAITR